MRTAVYKMALFTLIYFCSYSGGLAQQQSDSLMQYLGIAAKNNPAVLQKYYEYQAALQKVPQVGGLPDPELNAGVYLSPMELLSGNQVADIRFMQMLPWFGVLKNAKDEMSLMAKAKSESLRDVKLQIFYDVESTWYELCKNRQIIQISEKNIGILHAIERLALAKFKAASNVSSSNLSSDGNMSDNNTGRDISASQGMGGMSGVTLGNQSTDNNPSSMGPNTGGSGLADLYRIQIEIEELSNDIELLKDQQNTLIARFNGYLNRPPKTAVDIADTLKPDYSGKLLSVVPDSIMSGNPMLGMLQYEGQSLDARKKMVTRMGYPMVGIGINYSLISKNNMSTSKMNGNDMIMPMVTVTLPIYRKKYKAMQTEAELMKSATEQSYKAASYSLQNGYSEALQLYHDSERRMRLYTTQRLLIQKSLDILIKSFSASGNELTDLLRTRQQLLDYETKLVGSIADYNTSIAWLRRLMATSPVK